VNGVGLAVADDQEAHAGARRSVERAALGERQRDLDEPAVSFEPDASTQSQRAASVDRVDRDVLVGHPAHHAVREGHPPRAERGDRVRAAEVVEQHHA
jgi:hypothetical protein